MEKILVVDDSMFQRNRIREALAGCGLPIEEARNGREGLEKLGAGGFACVVTDLVMPEMDGFEFLAGASTAAPGVPIVVLTADIQHTTRARCQALGAADFVNKPMQAADLRAAVERLMAAVGK